jgi:hypothetical protein
LVADCDVCVVVADRELDVMTGYELDVVRDYELDVMTGYELDGVMDCDIYVEGYEAKEVSVLTYWSSRPSLDYVATTQVV